MFASPGIASAAVRCRSEHRLRSNFLHIVLDHMYVLSSRQIISDLAETQFWRRNLSVFLELTWVAGLVVSPHASFHKQI
jgi:hypothetical protein